MAIRESDIVHEAGRYWVAKSGHCYGVYRNEGTHAVRLYLYRPTVDTPNRKRDAITHCDRLAEDDTK